MFKILALSLSAFSFCFSNMAHSHTQHAHVHGLVEMDVAVENHTLSIFIQSPLDNFLGFEHTARTPEQIAQAQKVWHDFQNLHTLIEPEKTANCQRRELVLESDILENAQKTPKPRVQKTPFQAEVASMDEAHADLYAEIHWHCQNPVHKINLSDFLKHFPRIQKIQTQIATEKSQFLKNIDKNNSVLSWE